MSSLTNWPAPGVAMVPQITVVGILMIINGVFAALAGIVVALMGPLMFSMFRQMPPGPGGGPPQGFIDMISLMYLLMGTVTMIGGAMNIVGGARALVFRNRALVITALFFNITPMFNCYCLPTSLGIMIYGLIVMFQPDVAQAFALAEDGQPIEEIRRQLSPDRWRYARYERFDDMEGPRRRDKGRDEGNDESLPKPQPPAAPGEPGEGGDEQTFFEKH
jgi:hypothetical protein